jgi:hypothetical protein
MSVVVTPLKRDPADEQAVVQLLETAKARVLATR